MVGDRAEGIGMDDGDFVDGIVESSMRSLFPQLQADYQRELRSALSVAIRQSRGQPVATPGPERRPTPSEPAPAAPPPPTVARALGQKAQALRRAGAAQEAEAAPGGATAPSRRRARGGSENEAFEAGGSRFEAAGSGFEVFGRRRRFSAVFRPRDARQQLRLAEGVLGVPGSSRTAAGDPSYDPKATFDGAPGWKWEGEGLLRRRRGFSHKPSRLLRSVPCRRGRLRKLLRRPGDFRAF
ncbi:unnamed protein product [Prorocentrum cordatum]|uniref:Uncharacterized protein n=1 Tax=Prorocentrum cordatum TaxID=2364126 RepID=A0ABN9XI82_9DINO|nr:unnamed protein product [Polarella glacialis]